MSGERPPLSMNGREHWAKKAEITARIREEAGWRARAARVPALARCRVEVIWIAPDDGRRRDEDNPAPAAKAVYDGIVDVGIVADDTPKYMEKPAVRIITEADAMEEQQPFSAKQWWVRITEVV